MPVAKQSQWQPHPPTSTLRLSPLCIRHACVRVCVHACVRAFVCVRLCVHVCTCTCLCTQPRTHYAHGFSTPHHRETKFALLVPKGSTCTCACACVHVYMCGAKASAPCAQLLLACSVCAYVHVCVYAGAPGAATSTRLEVLAAGMRSKSADTRSLVRALNTHARTHARTRARALAHAPARPRARLRAHVRMDA